MISALKKEEPRLSCRDGITLDLRNMVWKAGEQELWTEQTGQLSWGKPRANIKGCSAEEEEDSALEKCTLLIQVSSYIHNKGEFTHPFITAKFSNCYSSYFHASCMSSVRSNIHFNFSHGWTIWLQNNKNLQILSPSRLIELEIPCGSGLRNKKKLTNLTTIVLTLSAFRDLAQRFSW